METLSLEQLLSILVQVVLIPAIPLITVLVSTLINKAVGYLNGKTENESVEKYVAMAGEMLAKAVLATSQTYVSTIKKEQGYLTKEQQLEAMKLSVDSFEKSIGESGKLALESIYGDYEHWLQQSIDALISQNHVEYPSRALQ